MGMIRNISVMYQYYSDFKQKFDVWWSKFKEWLKEYSSHFVLNIKMSWETLKKVHIVFQPLKLAVGHFLMAMLYLLHAIIPVKYTTKEYWNRPNIKRLK